MHYPRVDSPPRPPEHRATTRAAVPLASASLLLLVLVTAGWQPLMALDRQVSRTAHGWAVAESGFTQACRILSDWVWDPQTMRILCAGGRWCGWWCGARRGGRRCGWWSPSRSAPACSN
ncbi:hypothetical protein GCM10020295_09670 [Streptomyces cinereospinus]